MDERLIRLYALGCLNAAAVALRRRGEGRAWRQWLGYVAERARSRQLLFVAVASAWRQTLFALLGWRGVALSRRVARSGSKSAAKIPQQGAWPGTSPRRERREDERPPAAA